MDEVELTAWRVFRIWWAAAWRSFVLANLIGPLFLAILALGLRAIGYDTGPMTPWLFNAVIIAWVPAFVLGLRLALRAPYRDFRIVLGAPIT